MNVLLALTVAGFNEARRNRVTLVVALFALVLILMTGLVVNLTVFSLDRAVTDFGLGVMSLLLVALSMFLSVGMISREIEKRTVFLVMSRPLSRATFVVGRYLGIALTLTVLEAAMALIYLAQLALFHVTPTAAMGAALVTLWVELLALAAIGVFFSTFSGPLVGAVCLVSLYLIGHWSGDLAFLAEKGPTGLIRAAAQLGYWVMPNFDRLDYRVEASYGATIAWGQVATSMVAGLAWVAAFVSGACLVFQRRDFK